MEHGVGVNSSCVLNRAVSNAVIGLGVVGGAVHLGITGEHGPNVHKISVMRWRKKWYHFR